MNVEAVVKQLVTVHQLGESLVAQLRDPETRVALAIPGADLLLLQLRTEELARALEVFAYDRGIETEESVPT